MEGQSRESSSSSVGSASPASASVLEDLSVKQLKDLLKQNGVDPSGSVEKSDLIELAIKHNLQGKAEFYSIHKNHLSEEKSPYLLQHKDNPVHWFSYGPKAFEIAKKEDKPLLISIGYATCHWCHVMEHQSFEDETVAAALNQDFIPIKVDREEMPDVDTIYMNAAQSIGVSGGWPLNVFVTPDLKPFFAGTYFPKRSFLNVLARLSEGWKNERDKILEAGEVLFENLNENATRLYGKGEVPLDHSVLQKFYEHCRARYESDYGGFNSAPKFPPSVQLQVLLRLYRRTKDIQALKMVEGTLQGMVKGGMWDHLGGGFARYSTDERWLIPHFEKMLYDNALLLGVYLEAYQVTRDPLYASVARETAEYVLAVMHSPEGGFYSAEDADSEGVEGKFYVWTKKEIFSLLPVEEAERFCEVYGVTDEGNFEHGTTNLNLLDQERIDWRVKDDPVIKSASKKLYEIREKRIHPLKDDKQLTCWNGLMIKSMALAARVLHDDRYLEAAEKAASFFKEKMYHESTGTLLRRYRDGEAKFEGTLDDYAYMIAGLIQLYQTDFDQQWLEWAVRLQETQDKLFWDTQNGGYFFTPELSTVNVIVRTKDYFDGATPSGNLVSILNLLQLEHLTYDENKGYKATAEKVFKSVGKILGEHPEGFVSALVALDYYTDAAKQLAIILPEGGDPRGESAKEFLEIVSSNFLPNLVVACGAEGSSVGVLRSKVAVGGKPTAYLCEGTLCTAPTTDPVELSEKLLESIKGWTLDD